MIYVSIKPMTFETLSTLMKEFPNLPALSREKLNVKRIDLPTRRLAALALVRFALFHSGLYSKETASTAKIKHLETGQPFLEIQGADLSLPFLSISHSGKWIGCVIGEEPLPIGLDIEDMRLSRSISKIAEHAFFEEERDLLKRDEKLEFYKIWGAKEALAKCFGKGLSKALSINAGSLSIGNKVTVDQIEFTLTQDVIKNDVFLTIAQQSKRLQDIHFF